MKKAWVTFLSSNDYYIYLVIGLYKNILDTKSEYPFYCAVTEEVSDSTIKLLSDIGINIIKLNTSNILAFKHNLPWYTKAFKKLAIFTLDEYFDKIVYLDSDLYIKANIDELFNKEHLSAVPNRIKSDNKKVVTKYKIGDSVFCSGLLVWDFKNNKNLGKAIIAQLPLLDSTIAWHDQSVLNFWYSDWITKPELHLDATYGLMNTLDYNENTKVVHMVGRIRENWPFETKINVPKSYILFKEYCAQINKAISSLKADIKLLNLNNLM